MQKNTAGKWVVFAFTTADNLPATGDAAQITATLYIDGSSNAVDDTNPIELGGGLYAFDITAAEANGDSLAIFPDSSTVGVQVIGCPMACWTTPPDFDALTPAAIQAELEENGASLLDTIRDNIGTITNTGGTASIGAILGDFANTTLASGVKIADQVWDEAISGHATAGSTGKTVANLLQVLTGKWEITNNQLIMYAADGSTPLYTFNLTQDGSATEFNPDKRDPV